jgi:hypothetical protein
LVENTNPPKSSKLEIFFAIFDVFISYQRYQNQ